MKMVIEVFELAPRAFAAALFRVTETPPGPRLSFVRQAGGPTALQAAANLNAPPFVTVVQHTARNSCYEAVR